MKTELFYIFALYIAIISLVTAAITVADKIKAKRGSFRISENTLIILALAGGAVAEYTVMRLIRHKTLHKKFMTGLPLIIILQFITLILAYFYILH